MPMEEISWWMASGSELAVKINDLPNEILLEIFSYLPLDDMARCSHVCEKWHSLFKQEKELWRRKEWSSNSVGATRQLLTANSGMPQLKCLQLLYDGEYGIRITWPEVTVRLYVGAPFLWEPYFHCFDTESLVISQLVAENISGYMQCIDPQTLKRICIAEQHLEYRQPWKGPYFTFVPTSPHYSSPVRSYRCATIVHSTDQCYQHDSLTSGCSSTTNSVSVSRRPSISEHLSGISTSEAGAEGNSDEESSAVCPSLQVLNVHCKRLSWERLQELCCLGPLRVLRIESRGLRNLSVLHSCSSQLEELAIADCGLLAAEDFSELCHLTRLRVLRLSKCRVDELTLKVLTADLPHLQSLSLNGEEVK